MTRLYPNTRKRISSSTLSLRFTERVPVSYTIHSLNYGLNHEKDESVTKSRPTPCQGR